MQLDEIRGKTLMLEAAYSSYADENRRSFDKEDRQVRQSYTKKTPTMMVGVV